MTQVESPPISYAIAGSLAVHVLLAVSFALWIGLVSFHRTHLPSPPVAEEEPEVTLVFPKLEPVPPTLQKDINYIRTTQNTEAPQAPEKSDFISDRNTVASAKLAPTPDGDKPLPTMQGVDFPTKELADRAFRDGETKNDSAPPPPSPKAPPPVAKATPPPSPVPAPPTPQVKTPEPVAQPQVAKKEDAPIETMMKELDAALAKQEKPKEPKPQDQPPEDRTSKEAAGALPAMRSPEEKSAPRAIPMAMPVPNTLRPEKDAFQPETRRSSVKGTISNAGNEDAVNATATPKGRYVRQVTGAIEKKWHQYRLARADAVEPGRMRLRFFVNKNGEVEDLQFLFKQSNPLMEDFTIEAILKADIPPIPRDLLPILEKERVEITYNIVIH